MKIGEIEKIGTRDVPVTLPTFEPTRRDAPSRPEPTEPPAPAPERVKEKEPV